MRASADELIRALGLLPLPREGGWFRETWRSDDVWRAPALPARYASARVAATAILYLITASTPSRMHRLASPELYCLHEGDPVEMLQLHPNGRGEVVRLERDPTRAGALQTRVPAGSWQGSRVIAGGEWALFSVIVAPGFDPADYAHGSRGELTRGWPAYGALIEALTTD